ncbi:MAG: hypothetical protein ACXACP_00990 [Candidatus Hodarchaeales archaeon]|jgi:chromosome segregation ATPase
MPDEKDIIIGDLREEIIRIKNETQDQQQQERANSTELEKQLQESRDLLANVKTTSQTQEARITNLTNENQELKQNLEELQHTVEEKDSMVESYLLQIGKLQQLIENTENEIEEIEDKHLAIQNQLKQEIKRGDERVGQISEDRSRESKSSRARDNHIRTVLGETEIGKITLYLVDYFENPRKKALSLDTLASELKLAPIIVRSHLRYLHGLEVCKFNEVTREVKLIL